MINKKVIIICILAVCFMVSSLFPAGEKPILRTFPAKNTLKIDTVSANAQVLVGKEGEIKVQVPADLKEEFGESAISVEGDVLAIREKVSGFSMAGDSTLVVWAPKSTIIIFNSASGDFSTKGIQNNITVKTASGDLEATDCKGILEIKSVSGDVTAGNCSGEIGIGSVSGDLNANKITGTITVKTVSGDIEAGDLDGTITLKVVSGDIEIKKAKGVIKAASASGDLKAVDVRLTGESDFKTASGDVSVKLAETAAFNLSLASASGDVLLNYNGHPVKGYVEFSALADKGEIDSPFKFDKEEEIYKHGKKYLVKSFKIEGETPKIEISTASGKATLKK